MRRIFKILTYFLAAIGVCTASLVCFILIYPVFHGDFAPTPGRASSAPEKAGVSRDGAQTDQESAGLAKAGTDGSV